MHLPMRHKEHFDVTTHALFLSHHGCFSVPLLTWWLDYLLLAGNIARNGPFLASIHFKSRRPFKGSSPSMFQSDAPSGPGAALFKVVNRPCWVSSWQSLGSALVLLWRPHLHPPLIKVLMAVFHIRT